jgi:hypothetical protein
MKVLKIIEQKTSGISFSSRKYYIDTENLGSIDYDEKKEINWKEAGETIFSKKPIDLRSEVKKLKKSASIFTFFLDGSRRVYKVDDMSFDDNVYPIIAGQVGVGCCRRKNRMLQPAMSYERREVIALPDKAFSDDWRMEDKARHLLEEINERMKNRKQKIYFNDILIYNTDIDDKFENKAIAKVQDYMVELEKNLVLELANEKKLGTQNYLIKDGSLEYQTKSRKNNKNSINLSKNYVKNNYRYVIGVSKSFDPTKCLVKGGGTNSNIIANLKLFERTPAYRYKSTRAGVDFCIWYLRIREAQYSHSIFDGILKMEKLIITDDEINNGISTEEIDMLSAHLINERNPVCYGADSRWANHLYPIYLTEQYVKSKYRNSDLFFQIF